MSGRLPGDGGEMRKGQKSNPILKLVLMVAAAGLLFPRVGIAQTWNWTSEQVDVEDLSNSLATDPQGDLHLSYYVPMSG
jgi:hypothetical protein